MSPSGPKRQNHEEGSGGGRRRNKKQKKRNRTKRNVEVDKTERTLGRRTRVEINRNVKGKR